MERNRLVAPLVIVLKPDRCRTGSRAHGLAHGGAHAVGTNDEIVCTLLGPQLFRHYFTTLRFGARCSQDRVARAQLDFRPLAVEMDGYARDAMCDRDAVRVALRFLQ